MLWVCLLASFDNFYIRPICNKLFKIKLPQEFQSIWGLNLTVQTSKLKFSNFITNCVWLLFSGDFRWFSHLSQFVINFSNLNCPRSFQSICTCIFVTTNKRTELDSSDIKVEVFELYYKLRWLRFFGDFRWFSHLPQFVINFSNLNSPRSFKVYVPVFSLQLIRGLNLTVQTSKLKFSNFITNCVDCVLWRFSMIFAFTAICNKLFKLKLPMEFQSICTSIFDRTNKRTELDSSDIKDEVFELYYKLRWLRFFGDFRWFSHLPQFVINFSNLNSPRSFKVYVPVFSLQLIRGLNLTVQTSKLKFSNFITNCVDCVLWRFSMIFAFTAICNKLFKLKLPMEFQSICTSIFDRTNKRTELDSSDIKDEVFELYYKLRWLRFWRVSMIFAFTAICNKLSKLKLPQEFQSVCTCIFVSTNMRTELDWLVETKIEIFKLRNSWSNFSLESILQIAANVKIIEKRLKTSSTQFVIKFEISIFNA